MKTQKIKLNETQKKAVQFLILAALVSSIGAIILLWAFFEVGVSMQSQEGTMQAMGFKRVGGGLVMTLAPQLVSAIIG